MYVTDNLLHQLNTFLSLMSASKTDLRTVYVRPALKEDLCRPGGDEGEAGSNGVAEVLVEDYLRIIGPRQISNLSLRPLGDDDGEVL